jgi:superfamily II helicase
MKLQIDLHIHDDSTHADEKFDRILKLLEEIMHTLDETLAATNAETTADNSIIALFKGLQAQIAAGGLSTADQAKVDAIFTAATANASAVNTALAAGVTAPPAPAPVTGA